VTTVADQAFEDLLEYIKSNRGFDFTGYKRPSLFRRITKRMDVVGVQGFEAYREYLEEHEQEFVELFETVPAAYFVTDEYGKIKEANRTAADLLGHDVRFLVGKPLATFGRRSRSPSGRTARFTGSAG
jgi:PAS domain-containing protein